MIKQILQSTLRTGVRCFLFFLTLFLMLTFRAHAAANAIRESDELIFLPTFARALADGGCELNVHGWVFEYERRSALMGLFRKTLGLDENNMTEAERFTFARRANQFLVDNHRGRKVMIEVGGDRFTLPASAPNGHFSATLPLAATNLARWRSSGALTNGVIAFRAVLPEGDARAFTGGAMLAGETGLTFISDIDDTIKVTDVRDRRETIMNTFCRPFRAVDGMAAVYRGWAAHEGMQFHYVSASPWQLWPPLAEFARSNGFPAGSFHLKLFRWKDETFLNLFESPTLYKPAVIEPLMKQFPKRRFVFIGDSGEKDPEIYGALARKHPQQVARIFIRNVTDEDAAAPRYRKAFDKVPRELWQVFSDATELPKQIP